MFRGILLSAAVAGLLAALILTLAQITWITPLILRAETYEDAAESASVATAQHEHAVAHEHDHHHDAGDWKPSDGLQRTLFTLISNIVMGCGYALLLIGVYTVWRRPSGVVQGVLFGLAGFAVFFGAPGLGLPPELPGTEAAELVARQQWWIGTAIATALGLALIFSQRGWAQQNWGLRALGVAALVAPHLIGAPHPAIPASLAPAELQMQFRLATVISNVAFWLLLGAISAFALQKFSNSQPHAPS